MTQRFIVMLTSCDEEALQRRRLRVLVAVYCTSL